MTDYEKAHHNSSLKLEISRLKNRLDVFNILASRIVMDDIIEVARNHKEYSSEEVVQLVKTSYLRTISQLMSKIVTKYKQTELDYGTH